VTEEAASARSERPPGYPGTPLPEPFVSVARKEIAQPGVPKRRPGVGDHRHGAGGHTDSGRQASGADRLGEVREPRPQAGDVSIVC
jgi:hypothetical protein